MARPLRIEVPGGLYHIASHGNGQLWPFKDDKDRRRFLDLLGACATKYRITIHAFVLMINHFHLLIEIAIPNRSCFMRKFLSAYGITYNMRYGRRGSVFKARYGGFLIQKDRYYAAVITYLFNNPIRAGLVTDPFAYRWSSLHCLANRTLPQEVPWYEPSHLLHQVGGMQGLQEVMRSADETPPVFYHTLVGDKDWAEVIFKEHVRALDDEISLQHETQKELVKTLDIIDVAARALGVSREKIIAGEHKDARSICLYLFHKYTPLTDREIGEMFRMTKWAVSKAVTRIEAGRGRQLTIAESIRPRLAGLLGLGPKMSNVQT